MTGDWSRVEKTHFSRRSDGLDGGMCALRRESERRRKRDRIESRTWGNIMRRSVSEKCPRMPATAKLIPARYVYESPTKTCLPAHAHTYIHSYIHTCIHTYIRISPSQSSEHHGVFVCDSMAFRTLVKRTFEGYQLKRSTPIDTHPKMSISRSENWCEMDAVESGSGCAAI